jgi:ribonuclease-3
MNQEYNKKESKMTPEDIKKIEEIIGYTFENKELPVQAFTRKAFANENEGAEHNELLEHFGDTVLELAIKRALLREYAHFEKGRLVSNMNEGQFSSMEDAYVNNAHLAACIDKLGLVPYIRFGKGEEKQNCAEQNKAKSNLFEAIVFVVWVDCEENMDTVTRVVLRMLGLSDQNDI